MTICNHGSTDAAADDVGGINYPCIKVVYGAEGSVTAISADNPLPVNVISGGSGSSGGLTNTELRASPVPVSGTVGVSGTVPVSGTFWQATQPVSIASMPVTSVTGTFWQATQPVSIAGTVSVSGPLTDTQLRASAVPISIATMPSTPVTGTFWQATQPVSIAGTVATRDLKDASRTQFSAATVIGGVTCVTTEALLSMVPVRAGVAGSAGTSIAVTSGKTLRVTAIFVSCRSTSAAVLSGRFALRMNPSGAATATSPILAILSCTQQAAALAEAGDGQAFPIPDGLEISGTQQIGLTQVCAATTGVVYATIVGFEY